MSEKKHDMNEQESKLIDALLDESAQQAVRGFVKALPDDSLSMAWRSDLNEQLRAESARQSKKTRVAWFLRPALGLGLAGSLAVMVLLRTPPSLRTGFSESSISSGRLEAALVSTHRQTSFAMDVAGVGVNPNEVAYDDIPKQPTSQQWTEEDLDSL